MAIATPEVYAEMLQTAKEKGFAYPAVNVTSSQTLNAAIRGFAEAGSDGIIQASTGGAAYWSGASKKDMVVGSLAFAAYAREVAKQYDVNIALHTDHCPRTSWKASSCPCWPSPRRLLLAVKTPSSTPTCGRLRNRPGREPEDCC